MGTWDGWLWWIMFEKDEKKGRFARFRAILPIVLISAAAFQAAVFLGGAVRTWEPAIHDIFVRWRYYMLPDSEGRVHPDVAAVGIDASTQEKFGRFGAGAWLTKQPFVDQLTFLSEYVRPSVIAYDIIFEDPLGRASRKHRVTESEKRLGLVENQIATVKESSGVLIHPVVLSYMNRLSFEQGNSWLAHSLLRMRMPVVFAYYYRGGWMDPQVFTVKPWSEEDVLGDESGQGMRIPYLSDVRLPPADIHFAEGMGREQYGWAPNAKLCAQEFLDYTRQAFVNCPRDADGVVRRVPLVAGFRYHDPQSGREEYVFTPSLALLPFLLHIGIELPIKEGQVQVFLGSELVITPPEGAVRRVPIDELGRFTLNFDATFDDFKAVNLIDTAVPGRAPPEFKQARAAEIRSRLEGKVVLVGVTAAGQDSGPTPLSTKTPFMHVHLTAINNMLTGNYIMEVKAGEKKALYAILWIVVTLICCAERSARLGPTAIALTLAYSAAAFILIYGSIRIIPVIPPLFYITLCSFSVMTYRFFTEEKAKRKIRGMFSRMVSDKVLEYLEQNPGSFSLQGHRADVSVLFSDVGGFTSISEQLPPERLTKLLNKYFTAVTDCIMSNGGYLDKYVGDGVMAVWGAPFPDEGHAMKACRAALEQVRLLKEINPSLKEEFGMELSMRIGVNSGQAIAGNMGSYRKFQYTVMGDTVNLAARLEPANKDFNTSIIIGQETYRHVEKSLAGRLLARIIVKGKTEAVSIYELLGEKSEVAERDGGWLDLYDKAVRSFHERKWDESSEMLDGVLELKPNDGPAVFLKKQVEAMKNNPPPPGWQGEYTRAQKD